MWKNELLIHMITWLNFKCISLSKNKTKHAALKILHIVWFHYMTFWSGNIIDTENRFVMSGAGARKSWLQRSTREFGDNGTVLSHDYGTGHTSLFLCQNAQNCTPQRVNFIAGIWKNNTLHTAWTHRKVERETIDTWPLARVIRKHAKTPST